MSSSVNIGKRLRKAREAVGLKQNEAATMLNISNSNLSRYENGDRMPDADTLVKLSKLYDVTIDGLISSNEYEYAFLLSNSLFEKDMNCYLKLLTDFIFNNARRIVTADRDSIDFFEICEITDGGKDFSELDRVQREGLMDRLFTYDVMHGKFKPKFKLTNFNSSFFILDQKQKPVDEPLDLFVTIPALSSIKAGYDLFSEQQILDYEIVPKKWVQDGEYFFLNVTGNSMIDDGIKDGYRVLVRRQNYVEDGKIAVVMVNGNEGILRRVFYQDGDLILLVASNSNIPPRAYKPEEVIIHGQVVKVEFDLK